MRNIAIFGAGGLGREIACVVKLINQETPTWNLIGFFDDNPQLKGTRNEYGEVLGGVDELNAWSTPLSILVCIGAGSTVKKVVEKIKNPVIDFPNLVYNTTFSDVDNVRMGKGNIFAGGHVSCAVELGDFNLINGGCVFGHDDKVGSFNTFMPGVRVSGEVVIGNECFFGVNSIVLQQIKMDDKVRLGAGSVLMHKPKSDSLYIGNPAKLFKY